MQKKNNNKSIKKEGGCINTVKLSTYSLRRRSGNRPQTAAQFAERSRSMIAIYLNLMALGGVFLLTNAAKQGFYRLHSCVPVNLCGYV